METDMMTDDEFLREIGMTDGPKQVSKFKLRPVTALSLSWMQRHHLFDDSFGDILMKTAAFIYLHSIDRVTIRGVVNDHMAFLGAVDDWMEQNISHHTELDAASSEMSESLDRYLAAITTAAHPNDAQPGGIKN